MADESQTRAVADHIERGLDRYGRGELVAAIREWEVALRLDPSNLKARQYIQYVRENFESLADYFGRVVDERPPLPEGGPSWPAGSSPAEQVAQLASGWELEDEFVPDALPPPPTPAPVPSGIEVPPATEWAPRPPSFDSDLASVAQAVLEPFGIELTPPQSAREPLPPGRRERQGAGAGDEDESMSMGSLEALGVNPMEPEPLERLEPGLDLERTRAPSSRIPRTRAAPAGEQADRDRIAYASQFDAVTVERTAFAGVDADEGEAMPEPEVHTIERYAPPREDPAITELGQSQGGERPADELSDPGMSEELDFSSLLDDADETAKTQTRARALPDDILVPSPGRRVTRTANGIVVEFEAELPEDFQRTTTDQFGIGDFDEEGGLEDSQLDLEEEPTEERERAARASAAQAAADASIGPTIDDALLGLEAHEPDQPHVAELPLEPIAEDVSPPPHAPPVVLLHAPPRADAPAGPAIGSPSRSGPITFEHELTPLPEPYDPEAADEDPSLDARRTTPASVRDAEEAPGTPPPPDSPAGRVHAHLAEARKQFDRGDLVAAACAAEAAFTCDPQNVAAATREAERQLLIRIFETQLGSLRRVPKVLMTPPEIARLGLDHRFGFLLDRIDGATSFDDLLDIAGMPRLEAYRILEALVRKGVISA